jgi:hypothetical protein
MPRVATIAQADIDRAVKALVKVGRRPARTKANTNRMDCEMIKALIRMNRRTRATLAVVSGLATGAALALVAMEVLK